MAHKYLKDNNFPKFCWKDTLPKNDHRRPQWKEERSLYGFDERETWNLKSTFLCWLYEHIKRYIEVCKINLDYHTFMYKNKSYTQGELLIMILDNIELYYNINNCYVKKYGNDTVKMWDDQVKFMKEVCDMWSVVLPAMWW